LPGMQSAFVDIGLERDAFLYVSDFMELEDHDDDLTDVVPTNRPPVQENRTPAVRAEAAPTASSGTPYVIESEPCEDEASASGTDEEPASATGARPEPRSNENDGRDRNWRGRRRRRGRRGDRDERPERPIRSTPAPQTRVEDDDFGPPAGYEPILL